jgi:hypothetical protein
MAGQAAPKVSTERSEVPPVLVSAMILPASM